MPVSICALEGRTGLVVKSIGRGGYPDIAVALAGTIRCLYERGHNPDDQINPRLFTIARFNLEWLTDGKNFLSR